MTLRLAVERLEADLTDQHSVEGGECGTVDFDGETLELCEFETEEARTTYLARSDSSERTAKLDWLMTISAAEERTVEEAMSELTTGSGGC